MRNVEVVTTQPKFSELGKFLSQASLPIIIGFHDGRRYELRDNVTIGKSIISGEGVYDDGKGTVVYALISFVL